MTERRYSREEVDAILGRAVERERATDALSYEQLVAVAEEIGVSSASLKQAITEIASERQHQIELVQLRRQAWRGFFGHLIPYVCVNAILIVINLQTTRFPWAVFPLLGWGIGVFSHLLRVVAPNREVIEGRLQRQREREQRREARRLAKRRIEASAKEFETAISQGTAVLLEAAAKRINQGTESLKQQRLRVEETERDNARSGNTDDASTHKRSSR